MKSEQGNVNAENIGGTHDHEHELNKKLSKHNINPEKPAVSIHEVDDEKAPDAPKIRGVNAENVGGTAREERPGR